MTFNRLQKAILCVGFLALSFSLIWVPYNATFAREGDNFTRDVGYAAVFDAPEQLGCERAFGRRASARTLALACSVDVQTSRVLMTSAAIGIGTLALVVLAGFGGYREQDRHWETPRHAAGDEARPAQSLGQQLKARIPKIPVAGGNCTEDDPLVITATKDYVKVEYAVAEAVLKTSNLEFQLARQGLRKQGNRAIDVLTFDVKPEGSDQWTGQEILYFDITAGFSGLRR